MNRLLVIGAVAVSVSLTPTLATASPAKKLVSTSSASSDGPFRLQLERKEKLGDRTESTGSWKLLDYARRSAEGVSLDDFDKYIEAKYDVIEKITKVDDNGHAEAYRIYFQSFETRSDEGDKFEDASCVNVPIDVTVWPDRTIEREDGEEIPDDEMRLLKRMYPKLDPTATDANAVFDVPKEVSVGDSWSPKPESVGKMLQEQGIVMPDNAATTTLRISGRRKVNGVDCLQLDISMTCPEIDGISSLPQNIKSVHGGYSETQQILVPIDASQDIMGVTSEASGKFNAVIDDNDQPIEIAGRHVESHTDTFVKRM